MHFENVEECIELRSHLMNRILQSGDIRSDHFTDIKNELSNLIYQAIYGGESNSVLLIGPREVGKTKLVHALLENARDDQHFKSNIVLVQLNGLIHTDDRVALISITRQMNLDNTVEGKVFGSFAENLSFLLACLRKGNKNESKAIIFVIEEFDLFCTHNNQTLLYNLFDISQSAQAPLVIIGVTCRFDVIELLEKRVKSRFSHRQYFLFPGERESPAKRKSELEHCTETVKSLLIVQGAKMKTVSKSCADSWNEQVEILLNNKTFQTLMQRLIDLKGSDSALNKIMVQVLSQLSPARYHVHLSAFEHQMQGIEKDDVVEQLLDLSIVELCLLIAMKHHFEIYDGQPINFQMTYTRYMKFANVASKIQGVQKQVALKAFENLKSMEVIQIVSGTCAKLQKEYQIFRLLVSPWQIMDAVKRWHGLPTEVGQWATSSVV